jgi:hypothetical protein
MAIAKTYLIRGLIFLAFLPRACHIINLLLSVYFDLFPVLLVSGWRLDFPVVLVSLEGSRKK